MKTIGIQIKLSGCR
uniref:Uncharacterized protein n=1 Tax=Arundo donax TaxID=35708 RepID=A0A0A8Z2G4_ARUDO